MTLSCNKKVFALLHGMTSKHKGFFDCLSCLLSFQTENEIKSHEQVCKNKDFCEIMMSSEKDEVLEINQYMKSNKIPYITYAETESLIRNTKWMCK